MGSRAEICAAVDQDEAANRVYTHWFDHPTHRWNLAGVPAARLEAFEADLWWMSPPCQPYTVRGRQRDLADPRSRSFVAVMEHLAALRPPRVALENVPSFAGSAAHARLRAHLRRGAYQVVEQELCPSTLGVPSRRRRFYLLATAPELPPPRPVVAPPRPERPPLRSFLDDDPDPDLYVDPDVMRRYRGNLSTVHADDPSAVADCFTAAYHRSHVFSGSYLRDAQGLRRFSPGEILRLLGFPPQLIMPSDLRARTAYKLAGNSLSVVAVQALLAPWLTSRTPTTSP